MAIEQVGVKNGGLLKERRGEEYASRCVVPDSSGVVRGS